MLRQTTSIVSSCSYEACSQDGSAAVCHASYVFYVLQELAECLADPLVPKFSHRFFTGGAAAAVSAQQAHAANDNAGAEDDGLHEAPVVQKAVDYANKVQDSRKAAAAQQGGKKSKGKQSTAAVANKQPAQVSRQQAEEQALQAALQRSKTKKNMRQRNSKLTVIPAAFGREQQGADALQALRTKLARS